MALLLLCQRRTREMLKNSRRAKNKPAADRECCLGSYENFLDASISRWYPCAQCLDSSFSITLTPIMLVPIITWERDVGGCQMNRNRFRLTRYTKRPEHSGRYFYLHLSPLPSGERVPEGRV